ncbi:MAG TPA: 50S ribosomal protein L4 [Candidatus Nanoarchaeia archaeon]|nr:50S ribosomal protein L4 [Candidatus Nanoarchaeia archaeon]
MKLPIVSSGNKKTGDMNMPSQFKEEFRPDLIKRAVHALWSKARQAYGANPEAGLRHSSKLSKRRRKYRGCYGFGISRINRKILSRRGTRFNWVGAFSPQAVGGRRSHPPKAWKVLERKINKKENRKAIRSAMSATLLKEVVAGRGHKLPAEYPFVVNSTVESLSKTKEVEKLLLDLGFAAELTRSSQKKVRAGMGTMRGRKYKRKKGVLIVTSGDCPLLKAAQNVPGVDAVEVKAINAELLAPGADAGRVTLWTEKAVQTVADEKLFL